VWNLERRLACASLAKRNSRPLRARATAAFRVFLPLSLSTEDAALRVPALATLSPSFFANRPVLSEGQPIVAPTYRRTFGEVSALIKTKDGTLHLQKAGKAADANAPGSAASFLEISSSALGNGGDANLADMAAASLIALTDTETRDDRRLNLNTQQRVEQEMTRAIIVDHLNSNVQQPEDDHEIDDFMREAAQYGEDAEQEGMMRAHERELGNLLWKTGSALESMQLKFNKGLY